MPRITRFGPYELDGQTAELRKHGIRIRLHEQPFRILVMLLNQPGELVSREDLRKALWPNDTVVEFDHSINAAIQRLRDALSDSADKPRYVETVPRRGYRFIGTVEAPEPVPVAAAPPPAPTSNFRLMGKLGEGGMGVVYRAEDLKLGRQVALKFLPVPVAEAPSQMRVRFEREARAASALNHPHICTIYGVEEFQGEPVIVMELVEGETLAARLAKGPIPPDLAQQLAIKMAGALAAAHRKGIVHRDFKPANVMLPKTGLKVLDFGLAKIQRAAVAEAETATENTRAGTVLGTVQYMSPEQVRGQEADARSDIFSFGCVMLEMLTGQRAFTGDSTADLMGAILNNDPIIKPLPPGWDRIVRRCLEKNADDRFQSAADLAFDLEAISAGTPVAALAAPARHNSWLPWAVAGLLAAGLTFVAVSHFREKPFAPTTPSHFQVLFPPNAFPRDLSPDGRNIAYITADDRLGVHSLETQRFRNQGGKLCRVPRGAEFFQI